MHGCREPKKTHSEPPRSSWACRVRPGNCDHAVHWMLEWSCVQSQQGTRPMGGAGKPAGEQRNEEGHLTWTSWSVTSKEAETKNYIACSGNDQLYTVLKGKFLGGMCK